MESIVQSRDRAWPILAAAIAFPLTYLGARVVIDQDSWPLAVRFAAAAIPVLNFVVCLALWSGAVRRETDELERRIHLEALAISFPLVATLILALGMAQLVMPLPEEDLSYRHVWAFLPACYFVVLALVRKRYS